MSDADETIIPRNQWARKFDNELWSRSLCPVGGTDAKIGNHARCKASLVAHNNAAIAEMAQAKSQPEAIEHPPHYGGDTIYEVVKVCEAWGLDKDAYLFNVIKYVGRNGKKDGEPSLKDLKKARWYLNRRIDQLEGTKP